MKNFLKLFGRLLIAIVVRAVVEVLNEVFGSKKKARPQRP